MPAKIRRISEPKIGSNKRKKPGEGAHHLLVFFAHVPSWPRGQDDDGQDDVTRCTKGRLASLRASTGVRAMALGMPVHHAHYFARHCQCFGTGIFVVSGPRSAQGSKRAWVTDPMVGNIKLLGRVLLFVIWLEMGCVWTMFPEVPGEPAKI